MTPHFYPLPPRKTLHLRHLEALNNRCTTLSTTLEEKLGRELAGYLGEASLPYYLEISSISTHYDLYGLRLNLNGNKFQMDGLYLFEGFFLITEVKNFKNKILLNEANQLIQLQEEGSEEVFDNPLTQVELQKEQLIQLLDKHGYPTIPIETLVVFTHKKVHLTFNHPDLITSQQLPARLKRITQKYPTKLLQRNELYHLGRKLISLHEERGSAFINPNDKIFPKIKRGVFCNRCKPIIMRRIYGSWECPKCKKKKFVSAFSCI